MNEFTREKLLSAVLKPQPWLTQFTITDYAAAFQRYRDEFGQAYIEAVRAAEDLPSLAGELLDGMEADWARRRIWNRTSARLDTLQMLVVYLSPMLLALEEEPGCAQLAACVREGWVQRRPKEVYQVTSFQKVRSGFRRSILGIPLPDKPSEGEN